MRTIWKYQVPFTEQFSLDLPRGAEVLTMQLQREVPTIWVELDSDAPLISRTFALVGTGHPIPEDDVLMYVGTFQVQGGMFVYHLYEKLDLGPRMLPEVVRMEEES